MPRSDIAPGNIIVSAYTGRTFRRILAVEGTRTKVEALDGSSAYWLDTSAIERFWELVPGKGPSNG